MEKKIVTGNEMKNNCEALLCPIGFSETTMNRLNCELKLLENNCDFLSVLHQEGISLDDTVISSIESLVPMPLSSNEEINKLFSEMNVGDKQAKQKIIDANQAIVVLVVKEYFIVDKVSAKGKRLELSFENLLKIGNEGLEKAIRKFDFTMGYEFHDYALWWICSTLSRTLADLSHTPVHMTELI